MSRLSHAFFPLGLLTLSLGTWLACRPPANSNSTTRSLDNFAKTPEQKLTLNSCGPSYDGKQTLPAHVEALKSAVDAPDDVMRNAVLGVLVVVPKPILAPFFLSGGRVLVSKDAPQICRATPFSPEEKELAGQGGAPMTCWQQAQPGQPPRLVVAPNVVLIRHSLLRLFAYTYTEFFVARIASPKAPEPFNKPEWRSAVQGFERSRDKLAVAFLADLNAQRSPSQALLAKFYTADAVRFGNYVFAEALDSYFCSAKARTTFATDFKEAWQVFTDKSAPHSPVNLFGG